MKKLQKKDLSSLLVIVTGLNIAAWYFDQPLLLFISIAVGVISLLIPAAGYYLVWLWGKIAEILGWINSRIILSLIFFIVLTPISLIYRLFHKDPLALRKPKNNTVYNTRDHEYTSEDFQNTW